MPAWFEGRPTGENSSQKSFYPVQYLVNQALPYSSLTAQTRWSRAAPRKDQGAELPNRNQGGPAGRPGNLLS